MLQDFIKSKCLKIEKPGEVDTYFDTVNDLYMAINCSTDVIDGHSCLVMDFFFANKDIIRTVIDMTSSDFINIYVKENGKKRTSRAVLCNMYSLQFYKPYVILNKRLAFDYFRLTKLDNKELWAEISEFQQEVVDKIKAEKEKPITDILEAIPFDEVSDAQYKWALRTHKTFSRENKTNLCYVSFMSKVSNALVHRHFRIFFNKRINDYEFYEFGRDVIINNQVHKYWSPKYDKLWLKGRGLYSKNNFQDGFLYSGNLKTTLKGTPFERSGFYEFVVGCKGYTFPWEKYPTMAIKVPQLEKLSKVGLYNIAAYVVTLDSYNKNKYFDFSKNDLLGFLKLPNRKYLHLLIERDGSVTSDLSFMQKYLKLGVSVTDSDFIDLLEINNYNFFFDIQKMITTSKKSGISTHKILKYCKSQSTQNNSKKAFYVDLERNISLYCDYINFISKMNYDLKLNANRYPKNIEKAHNQASELYDCIVKEALEEDFKNFYKTLKPLSNKEIENYVFKIPSCNDDIIKQGQKEHNCVGRGTYFEKMAARKILLVFINNKQNNETATMEINAGGSIVQLRSKDNKKVTQQLTLISEHYVRLLHKYLSFDNKTISINTDELQAISA